MAVKVARGVLSRIREEPEMIALQVRGASDPDAALRALERACGDICALDAGWESAWGLSPGDLNNPKWVSGAMLTGPGPMAVPYRFLRRIPEMVARRLEEEGVTEAVVGVPDEGNLPWPWDIPRAVSLRLFPPPPLSSRPAYADVPVGWLDHAMAWALDELGDGDGLWGQVVATRFPLEAGEAAAYFARAHAARTGTELWAGDPASRIRLADGAFERYHQSLVLAGGGPKASDTELVEIMERLKDVGRALAPDVAQAFIDIHPTFSGPAEPHSESSTVEPLCDEQALDAFPWQVLGPGHLARLGGPPPGALPLGGGRVEVAVGDTAEWLSERLRPTVHEQGRQLLAPLLLPYEKANDIYAARYGWASTATRTSRRRADAGALLDRSRRKVRRALERVVYKFDQRMAHRWHIRFRQRARPTQSGARSCTGMLVRSKR